MTSCPGTCPGMVSCWSGAEDGGLNPVAQGGTAPTIGGVSYPTGQACANRRQTLAVAVRLARQRSSR